MLKTKLNMFFYDSENGNHISSRRDYMENILLFESDREHKLFREYIKKKWKDKDLYAENILLPCFPEIEGYNMEVMKKQ